MTAVLQYYRDDSRDWRIVTGTTFARGCSVNISSILSCLLQKLTPMANLDALLDFIRMVFLARGAFHGILETFLCTYLCVSAEVYTTCRWSIIIAVSRNQVQCVRFPLQVLYFSTYQLAVIQHDPHSSSGVENVSGNIWANHCIS